MKFRQRGFHYLGNLGSRLADLQGYSTLAQELIQNADDVGNAGFLRFDIRKDALVVDNGGVFRSCGQLESYDCPWLDDPHRDPTNPWTLRLSPVRLDREWRQASRRQYDRRLWNWVPDRLSDYRRS